MNNLTCCVYCKNHTIEAINTKVDFPLQKVEKTDQTAKQNKSYKTLKEIYLAILE